MTEPYGEEVSREKGVASAPCPNCGTELNRVTQPDGGVAFESCGNCYPATPEPERASVQQSFSRETGTTIDTGGNDE